MGFRHVEKPYKPCRKWSFLRGPELKSELRLALLSYPDGAGIPPLYFDGRGARKVISPGLQDPEIIVKELLPLWQQSREVVPVNPSSQKVVFPEF